MPHFQTELNRQAANQGNIIPWCHIRALDSIVQHEVLLLHYDALTSDIERVPAQTASLLLLSAGLTKSTPAIVRICSCGNSLCAAMPSMHYACDSDCARDSSSLHSYVGSTLIYSVVPNLIYSSPSF